MEEVTDEPLYRDRVCGIDINRPHGRDDPVPSDKNPARRASETRIFATTKRGVLELRTGCVAGACRRHGGDERLLEAGVVPAGG